MAKKKSSLDELEKSELEVTDAAPVEKKKRRTKKAEPEVANAETEGNAQSAEAEKPQAQTDAPKRTRGAFVPKKLEKTENADKTPPAAPPQPSPTVVESPKAPFVPKKLERTSLPPQVTSVAASAPAPFVPKKLERPASVSQTPSESSAQEPPQTPSHSQVFEPKKLEKEHWILHKEARDRAEERERQEVQQLKDEFRVLSTADQQGILYYMIKERLYWRLICYMRRYPERLSSKGGYSSLGVGNEEFLKIMGYRGESSTADEWLDSHYVPVSDDAESSVLNFNKRINTLLEVESDCPISVIKRHFALSDDEFEILGTLVSAMCEENLLRLMTVVWADATIKLPSVTFLCHLLSDDEEKFDKILELLSEDGTLRRMRLIHALHSEYFAMKTPLAYMLLTVEQPVINAFCGRGKILDFSPNMSIHRNALPKRAIIADKDTLEEMKYIISMEGARLCLLGPRHSGRCTLLTFVSLQTRKMPVLELDACHEFERVSSEDIEIHFSCTLRQALLAGCLLSLRFDGIEDKPEVLQKLVEHQAQLERIVSFYPGEIVILTQKMHPFFEDVFNKPTTIRILPPDVELAADVWRRALDHKCSQEASEHMADLFSHNYTLPIGSIFGVVRDAMDALQATSRKAVELQSHHILEEIRKSFRHQLGSLAEITVSNVPLEGVVLPPEAKAQVNEILQYAKNLHNVLDVWGFRERSPYGNALSVLFAGPPGTGKTLLACALANELGKVLYRVDISRIVDKYIGETEKNLGKIFDEAAKAQAIILFDEADALFAKRTEVKSSNDRNSNMEINFLLQKLESYNGITILTTNLSKSIDEAFRRRLRFIIDFPMPDVASRISLWKRMMPPGAPLSDDIRWSWLAHTFEMSGGYIRNAVLKAAISASAANVPISMRHLAKAAADEARSMGKLMRIDEDFDDYDAEFED